MVRPGYVYIMASKKNGTIYIGVSSDLAQRVWQHREALIEGFTKKYGCKRLVWFEPFESIHDARVFEARMKKWNRDWKIKRIEERNPNWDDLFDTLI
jgi:putative endonuclease